MLVSIGGLVPRYSPHLEGIRMQQQATIILLQKCSIRKLVSCLVRSQIAMIHLLWEACLQEKILSTQTMTAPSPALQTRMQDQSRSQHLKKVQRPNLSSLIWMRNKSRIPIPLNQACTNKARTGARLSTQTPTVAPNVKSTSQVQKNSGKDL